MLILSSLNQWLPNNYTEFPNNKPYFSNKTQDFPGLTRIFLNNASNYFYYHYSNLDQLQRKDKSTEIRNIK